MANAWALSALWVELALVATLLAMGFKASASFAETVAGTAARLIIGVIYGVGGMHRAKQRNEILGSAEITLQLNNEIRHCAFADMGFVKSCVFGAVGSLQLAARRPGKGKHHD